MIRRILVVDDTPIALVGMRALLETIGAEIEIVTAGGATEAISKIREAVAAGQPFKLAIVDYRMPPGPYGDTLVAVVQAESPDTPTLMTSSMSYAEYDKLPVRATEFFQKGDGDPRGVVRRLLGL